MLFFFCDVMPNTAASFLFLFLLIFIFFLSGVFFVAFFLIGFFRLTFTFLFKTRAIFSMSYCCLAAGWRRKKKHTTLISKWNGYFSCGPDLFLMPYRRVRRGAGKPTRKHLWKPRTRSLWNMWLESERRFGFGLCYIFAPQGSQGRGHFWDGIKVSVCEWVYGSGAGWQLEKLPWIIPLIKNIWWRRITEADRMALAIAVVAALDMFLYKFDCILIWGNTFIFKEEYVINICLQCSLFLNYFC